MILIGIAVLSAGAGLYAVVSLVRGGGGLFSSRRRAAVCLICALVALGASLTGAYVERRHKQAMTPADFASWYESVAAIRRKADKGMSQYKDMVDGVARATMVQYAAEREFTNMKTAQDVAVTAIGAVSMPPGVTSAQEQTLRDALKGAAAALTERAAVMEAYLPYAKDKKAVDVSAAEERMLRAQGNLAAAFDAIAGVGGERR